MAQEDTIDLAEIRRLSDQLFQRLEHNGVRRVGAASRHCGTMVASGDFSLGDTAGPGVRDAFGDPAQHAARAGNDQEMVFWNALHHLSGLMMVLASADMAGKRGVPAAEEDR